MAEFKTRYDSLVFYAGGVSKQFNGGRYATEDDAEIEELSKLPDVERIDAPADEVPEAPAKATAQRKSSDK